MLVLVVGDLVPVGPAPSVMGGEVVSSVPVDAEVGTGEDDETVKRGGLLSALGSTV